MTIPHTKYGHSPSTHFRYFTCLLDRGHIIYAKPALFYIDAVQSVPNPLYKAIWKIRLRQWHIPNALIP